MDIPVGELVTRQRLTRDRRPARRSWGVRREVLGRAALGGQGTDPALPRSVGDKEGRGALGPEGPPKAYRRYYCSKSRHFSGAGPMRRRRSALPWGYPPGIIRINDYLMTTQNSLTRAAAYRDRRDI
jgi:hypothetical protein